LKYHFIFSKLCRIKY